VNSTNYLTEGHLFRGLITISLPIIASNLLQSVLEVVDLYFVGRLGANEAALPDTTIIFVPTFVIGLVTAQLHLFTSWWDTMGRVDCPFFFIGLIFHFILCIQALLKGPSFAAGSERNSCHTGFCLSFGAFFRNFHNDRTLGSNQLFSGLW
jgi:hypothetical protein